MHCGLPIFLVPELARRVLRSAAQRLARRLQSRSDQKPPKQAKKQWRKDRPQIRRREGRSDEQGYHATTTVALSLCLQRPSDGDWATASRKHEEDHLTTCSTPCAVANHLHRQHFDAHACTQRPKRLYTIIRILPRRQTTCSHMQLAFDERRKGRFTSGCMRVQKGPCRIATPERPAGRIHNNGTLICTNRCRHDKGTNKCAVRAQHARSKKTRSAALPFPTITLTNANVIFSNTDPLHMSGLPACVTRLSHPFGHFGLCSDPRRQPGVGGAQSTRYAVLQQPFSPFPVKITRARRRRRSFQRSA